MSGKGKGVEEQKQGILKPIGADLGSIIKGHDIPLGSISSWWWSVERRTGGDPRPLADDDPRRKPYLKATNRREMVMDTGREGASLHFWCSYPRAALLLQAEGAVRYIHKLGECPMHQSKGLQWMHARSEKAENKDMTPFFQVVNLQNRWWKKPIPTVRTASYELRQLSTLRYELEPQVEVIHNF